jgi:hypothetical protein
MERSTKDLKDRSDSTNGANICNRRVNDSPIVFTGVHGSGNVYELIQNIHDPSRILGILEGFV